VTTCVDIINRGLLLLGVSRISATALTAAAITETAPNGGTAANLTDGDETTLVTTTGGASTTDPFVIAHADLGSAQGVAYVDLQNLSLSGTTPTGTCTPSATTGTAITLTGSSAVFASTDVGEYVTGNGGIALITGFTSTTVVTAEVLTPFISTAAIANGSWTQYLPSNQVWLQWSDDDLKWHKAGSVITVGPTAVQVRRSLAVNARYLRVARVGNTDLGTANFSLGEMTVYAFGTNDTPLKLYLHVINFRLQSVSHRLCHNI